VARTLWKCYFFVYLISAQYLSQNHLLGKQRALKFVMGAGTSTTPVGVGLAVAALYLRCGSVCSMLIYFLTILLLQFILGF
jgi:hypothetical protein